MLRTLTRLGPITLTSVFPVSLNKNDKIVLKPGQEMEIDKNQTGMDRIRALFYIDEFDQIAPEINFVLQSTFTATLFGAIYGGFLHSRTAYMNYIEKHQATHYEHIYEAKKTLQDKVTLSFARGGFRWGWRLGIFTATYTMLTTCISVYRGKSSIVEYSVAGLLTGGIYKCNLGLRASVVGGTLGVILGTVLGGCSLMLLRLTGTTMDDVYKTQYQYRKNRYEMKIKMMDKSSTESEDELTSFHNEIAKQDQKEKPSSYFPDLPENSGQSPLAPSMPINAKNG